MSDDKLAARVTFRFAAIYFLLYSLYNVHYPVGIVFQWLAPVWDEVMQVVGRWVLGIDDYIVIYHNGSGDTTADYVRAFTFALLAAIACIVWTAIERKRDYPRFAAWLVTWARYWLATWMIIYGIGKVIPPRQFPPPDIVTLTQTYGESSPMGLAWTFMGQSQGYTTFTGLAETLGGVLLLFRRTTTLGALVCVGVMANVVALNFFYDIAVKLFSSHLLAVALILAALDWRRLVGVFLRGDAVPAKTTEPVLSERPRLRRGLKIGYVAVVAVMMVFYVQTTMTYFTTPKIYGVYEVVEDRVTCGTQFECGPSDEVPLRRVVFGNYDQMALDFTSGPRRVFFIEVTEELGQLSLKSSDDDEDIPIWTFERDGDLLRLDGRLGPARHEVTLQPAGEPFLLEERGFRWISETPYNR
jgi:uncharacterized membrane protein YphA (DoxX/SURF4 family)